MARASGVRPVYAPFAVGNKNSEYVQLVKPDSDSHFAFSPIDVAGFF
jgi:hypothetical protein